MLDFTTKQDTLYKISPSPFWKDTKMVSCNLDIQDKISELIPLHDDSDDGDNGGVDNDEDDDD